MIEEGLPRWPVRREIRHGVERRRTNDLAVLPPGPHERGIPFGQRLPTSPANDAAGGVVHAVQPLVDVAVVEHDFGLRVGGDELFGEADGRNVLDAVVVAQDAVEFFAAPGLALAVELGAQGLDPEGEAQFGGLYGCAAKIGC